MSSSVHTGENMTDPLPGLGAHDAAHCEFLKLLDEMHKMHLQKSVYGSQEDHWRNMRQAVNWGASPLQGGFIRMNDKWSRLQTIWENTDADIGDETMVDTLMDLAGYALINICLIREDQAFLRNTGVDKG